MWFPVYPLEHQLRPFHLRAVPRPSFDLRARRAVMMTTTQQMVEWNASLPVDRPVEGLNDHPVAMKKTFPRDVIVEIDFWETKTGAKRRNLLPRRIVRAAIVRMADESEEAASPRNGQKRSKLDRCQLRKLDHRLLLHGKVIDRSNRLLQLLVWYRLEMTAPFLVTMTTMIAPQSLLETTPCRR